MLATILQASSLIRPTSSGNRLLYMTVALTFSLFQTAAVGDIVEFTFHPKNHSVTQSSFAEPCTPLPGGFDTGLCVPFNPENAFFFSECFFAPHSLPVASGTSSSGLPMRQLTVNDVRGLSIYLHDVNYPFSDLSY